MGRWTRAERLFHHTMKEMRPAFEAKNSSPLAKANAFRDIFTVHFDRIDLRRLDYHDNSQLRLYMYELSKQLSEHGFMLRVPGDIFDDFRSFELELIHFPLVNKREVRPTYHDKLQREVDRSFFTVTFDNTDTPPLINPFENALSGPVVVSKVGKTLMIDGLPAQTLSVKDRFVQTVDMGFEYLFLLHFCDVSPLMPSSTSDYR